MARPDVGTFTPDSLTTVAEALEAIVARVKRAAEAMKEKKIASLEIKNQAALKSAIVSVRGFGMAAEEALEEWLFDQNLFKEPVRPVDPAEEPAKPRQGKKGKKEQDVPAEDSSGDEQ
jgi:hypothetical protein